MALEWQAAAGGLAYGGYAAWEKAIEAAAGGPARLIPVMARLVQPAGSTMDLKGAIAATLAQTDAEIPPHERDLLETDRAHAGDGWPHEVRFVAYAPRSLLDNLPPFWSVLGIGPGFLPAELAPHPAEPVELTTLLGPLSPDVPVAGIIDDGIGFLNGRFRASQERTRFLGIWLQASERTALGTFGPNSDIRLGRVLQGHEIDGILGSGLREQEAYTYVNRTLYPLPDRSATARRVGHGTHVLDLACGAGFAEEMAASPILAVQLPPSSVRETAGRRMEAQLIQGLRWILAEVLRQSDKNKAPPLVLNLSMGSLAGPGDATEFLADWIGYEIDRHKRLAPGAEVRITGSYGNARLSRLAARAEVRIHHPLTLDWRVQPDDRTASFLELRVDQTQTAGLALTLTPPVGSGLPPVTASWPEVAGGHWLTAPQGPVAAISFLPEPGGQALLHIALAPTVAQPGGAVSSPGLWRLTLTTAKNEPVRAVARVQRDDTPFGHAAFGRQSWLDHPEGWTWDTTARSYTAPQKAAEGVIPCPVTREGTAVSYAGINRPEVWMVGSIRPQDVPSVFSSEGAEYLFRPGESAGPDIVALGETGGFTGGILASAMLTGSKARLGGTSMAAPAVARRLIGYFRSTPPADRSIEAERQALVGPDNWDPVTDRRMGHGVLT
jgi:hypothetical protein